MPLISRISRFNRFTFPSMGSGTYHRPLIPATIAVGVGIAIGGTWPGHLAIVTTAGLFALAGLSHACFHRRRVGLIPLLLLSLLGYGLISPWLPGQFPENHISRFTDSHHWQIDGYVTKILPERYNHFRFFLEVRNLRYGDQTHAVKGGIRVAVSGETPPITPGAHLTFRSRVRSFHNFSNPGGFDYRRYMMFQHVFGSAYTKGTDLVVIAPKEKPTEGRLEAFRARARDTIDQLKDANTRAVMRALLIGDRHGLSPEIRNTFNRCGVGHLLAISGLHIGIVGGLIFGVMQWFLNRFNFILVRGWGRRGATLISVGPIVFYAILAGLSPSTQRALIMVLAFLTTYYIYRDGDTLNFLALAALVMLIWHPPAIFSISFQLSFAAVFWIVLGLSASPKDQMRATSTMDRLKVRLTAFILVTIWATVGTLPLVMLYFQQLSFIGLLTNGVMVPLMGFFVLPLGLLSLAMLPLSSFISGLGIELTGAALSQALSMLHALNAMDGIAMKTFAPTVLEVVCFYMLLGLYIKKAAIGPVRIIFMVVMVVMIADGIYWYHERFGHRDLRVTIIDVGQGSATLVEFPGGRTMLVDGGGYTSNRFFDVGERIIAPFLRHRKILQIDSIVLSHPSSDHMNGLVYVMAHFQPTTLLWTGDRASTESFHTFFKEVIRCGVHVPSFHRMPREFKIGQVNVQILHPSPGRHGSDRHFPDRDCNNRSIVLKLALGSCDLLLPGDIEFEAEEELIAACLPLLTSRVLVAPHHGSRSSSSKAFLEAVNPDIVIISAGWQNRFGFPHPAVIERYRDMGAEIYRTDISGAINLRTNGRRWSIGTSGG